MLRKTAPLPPATLTAAETEAAAPALEMTKTPYAVVCKTPSIVHRILAAKRAFSALKFFQLDANALISAGLAVFQPGDPFINLNGLLPSHVLRLLNETKTQLKAVGFKYIWCRNSTEFAKFSDDAPVQIIYSQADLPRIVQLYTSSNPNQQ